LWLSFTAERAGKGANRLSSAAMNRYLIQVSKVAAPL